MELESSMSSLRMSLHVVQKANFHIFNALVRAGAEPRERVLAFWGDICHLNAKRGAMQVRSREVATDAFMSLTSSSAFQNHSPSQHAARLTELIPCTSSHSGDGIRRH